MRLIDANTLMKRQGIKDFSIGVEDIISAPTIDAVQVVRCKDCRYCEYENDRLFCDVHGEYTTAEYFCASGIRQEDKNDGYRNGEANAE